VTLISLIQNDKAEADTQKLTYFSKVNTEADILFQSQLYMRKWDDGGGRGGGGGVGGRW